MGKGSFQPVHPRHIIHFHTNGCSKLLQVKQQMILLYLLYLAGYMLHGPGKNFHFFTRTKFMLGCLAQEILDSVYLLLADNSRFTVIKDDTDNAIYLKQVTQHRIRTAHKYIRTE